MAKDLYTIAKNLYTMVEDLTQPDPASARPQIYIHSAGKKMKISWNVEGPESQDVAWLQIYIHSAGKENKNIPGPVAQWGRNV